MSELASQIAVIGMAVRAPKAADRHEFWANTVANTECLSTLDDEEPSGSWVPVKGVLEGAEFFDAEFFGFSPREAEITDPQQRVFLELAWHAIEDAGHTPHNCGRVGVFASATQSRYARLVEQAHPGMAVGDLQLRIASESDFLATRTAYKLGLRGPAMTVQTACSSSLVAVHVACNALLAGDCDTAVAGGVTITLPLLAGYRYQPGSILSPDGHCRAFDISAAGTVPGNGGAAVVLRRLDDAIADGDDVYAVILGSAVNNDGEHKIGFTAPSASGQQAVITAALRTASVQPDEVGLIEAHGTGTALGDPIEVGALRKVFGPPRADESWCGLSAAKSAIGHLDAAAGIVGFARAVLAVHHGQIPPTVGFRAAHPDLHLDDSPLRVVAAATPWPASARRVAGVSAFGVGGTNAHVVLAEAPVVRAHLTLPAATHAGEAGPLPRAKTAQPQERIELRISARTAQGLDDMARVLAEHLEHEPHVSVADVAYTLAVGRVPMPFQRTVTAATAAEAAAALRAETATIHLDRPSAIVPHGTGKRIRLPGYPFQRQRFWPQPSSPADTAQEWLPGLFGEVLGRLPANEDESFFDLGGDSLMAIQLMSRVSAVSGVDTDLDQFFDEPTVAGLAALIERAEAP